MKVPLTLRAAALLAVLALTATGACWFFVIRPLALSPQENLYATITIAAILTLLFAGAAWLLHIRYTKRIVDLTDWTRQIVSGESGQTLALTGNDELAELSRSFAELAKSARREVRDISAALDAHSIVAITNPAGKITYANDKFCELSKYAREELLGQDHRLINSGYHPKEFFRDLWTTIAAGKVWKGEIRNRAKDGSYYWVDTTIFPFLSDDQKPSKYVAIRTDITERKQNEFRLSHLAQELAEKNKEMETMLYVVSHDLRAPLLNIQGFGAALLRSCEELKAELAASRTPTVDRIMETDVPRALHFIKSGITKMDSLLNGFLRFSRSGRVELNIETIEMEKIVQATVQALKFQIDAAGAEVNIGSLPACRGDAVLLSQVFANLLDNALKYRSQDRPCRISIVAGEEAGKIIYSVSDNGIGIPPEHQPKIFELFHRLDPKNTEGEGLGLTITQRIVERHHGQIWMNSQPGTGTTFFVSLPSVTSAAS